jgi:uncharacterized surface protein with fasciclin (FAS1) repeats
MQYKKPNIIFTALLIVILCLAANVYAQQEIALFSKMTVAEDGDPAEEQEKSYPSLDNIVRTLRGFKGLEGEKAFTMFVPNNEAFKKLPKGTLQYFVQDENKKAMEELISFHVVEEKLTIGDIESKIKNAGGKTIIKSLSGFKIRAYFGPDKKVVLENEAGKKINITAYNYKKGNGIIHVVDSVVIPYDHGMLEEAEEQGLN